MIANKDNEKQCILCGFDKIIVMHQCDNNYQILLCPNHHEMIHSKEHRDIVISELIHRT